MSIVGELVELNTKGLPQIVTNICGYKNDPYREKNKVVDPITNTVYEEDNGSPIVVDKEDVGMIVETKGKYVLVSWIKSGCLWTWYKHINLL